MLKLLRESEIMHSYESWERLGTFWDLVSETLYRNLINMNSILHSDENHSPTNETKAYDRIRITKTPNSSL